MRQIKDLGKGFGYLVRGFTFLAGHPRLWGWAAIPTIINLLLLAAMIGLFAHFYGDLYTWLAARLGIHGFSVPDAWWQHVINWIISAGNLLFQIFIVLLSLLMILIVSYAASFVVAGPFNDMLSEQVEKMATGVEPPPFALKKFASDLVRTVKVESIKAGVLLSIPVALFVVSFIPIVGGPIYVALTFVFGAWDLGFSYADLSFGRRARPFAERLAFARREKWALIGLGAGFVIPFFALIFASPMVVGGTLLYIDRTRLMAEKA